MKGPALTSLSREAPGYLLGESPEYEGIPPNRSPSQRPVPPLGGTSEEGGIRPHRNAKEIRN